LGETRWFWSAIRNTSDRERSIAPIRAGMENRRLVLKGLIYICAWRKRICDEGGLWQQLEPTSNHNSEAKFSHGICPDCLKKLDPSHHLPAVEEGGSIEAVHS